MLVEECPLQGVFRVIGNGEYFRSGGAVDVGCSVPSARIGAPVFLSSLAECYPLGDVSAYEGADTKAGSLIPINEVVMGDVIRASSGVVVDFLVVAATALFVTCVPVIAYCDIPVGTEVTYLSQAPNLAYSFLHLNPCYECGAFSVVDQQTPVDGSKMLVCVACGSKYLVMRGKS